MIMLLRHVINMEWRWHLPESVCSIIKNAAYVCIIRIKKSRWFTGFFFALKLANVMKLITLKKRQKQTIVVKF